mmetsp:Transcript_3375/g.13009  ORF Transcript_3375/g.13009 Transcript_3375/m.13009 type:complete len:282 (+) Transcript_3375:661-1506(+)
MRIEAGVLELEDEREARLVVRRRRVRRPQKIDDAVSARRDAGGVLERGAAEDDQRRPGRGAARGLDRYPRPHRAVEHLEPGRRRDGRDDDERLVDVLGDEDGRRRRPVIIRSGLLIFSLVGKRKDERAVVVVVGASGASRTVDHRGCAERTENVVCEAPQRPRRATKHAPRLGAVGSGPTDFCRGPPRRVTELRAPEVGRGDAEALAHAGLPLVAAPEQRDAALAHVHAADARLWLVSQALDHLCREVEVLVRHRPRDSCADNTHSDAPPCGRSGARRRRA